MCLGACRVLASACIGLVRACMYVWCVIYVFFKWVFFGCVLANAIFPPVDFHSSVLAFQHLLYDQVIISLHFRILDTPTEHVFTNLVFAFYFSDLIFWCSLAEAIFRILAFYRSLLPSQILSYDHNIMSLHFRTHKTPTEHAFANLVFAFFVWTIVAARSHLVFSLFPRKNMVCCAQAGDQSVVINPMAVVANTVVHPV